MDTAKIINSLKEWMPGLRNDDITLAWQHPIDVMNVFDEMLSSTDAFTLDAELDEVFRVVCLLHDILEDGIKDSKKFSEEDLATYIRVDMNTFSSQNSHKIQCAIMALTKVGNTSFGTMGLLSYFMKLSRNDIAIIVKCCDRISNLRTAEKDFEPYRFERYRWETKMFVIPMLDNLLDFNKWDTWLRNELTELS